MRNIILALILLVFPLLSYAEECSYSEANMIAEDLTAPLTDAAKFSLIAASRDCILTIFDSALETTKGAAKSAVNCVLDPIDCAEMGIAAVKNVYHFITHLSQELNKIWSSLKKMKASDIPGILCKTIGELAPDILIGILTAGAASGKFGLTVSRIVQKLQRLGNILGEIVGLPLRIFEELGDGAMEILEAILKRGDKQHFLNQLRGSACVF